MTEKKRQNQSVLHVFGNEQVSIYYISKIDLNAALRTRKIIAMITKDEILKTTK